MVSNENKETCAACSKPADCEIWTHPVCYDCASDFRDRAPTFGDIVEKYGPNADTVAIHAAFVERWLEKRRKEAA